MPGGGAAARCGSATTAPVRRRRRGSRRTAAACVPPARQAAPSLCPDAARRGPRSRSHGLSPPPDSWRSGRTPGERRRYPCPAQCLRQAGSSGIPPAAAGQPPARTRRGSPPWPSGQSEPPRPVRRLLLQAAIEAPETPLWGAGSWQQASAAVVRAMGAAWPQRRTAKP